MKRLTKHTVDLAAIASRARPENRAQLDAFNERCKRYVAKVASLPASMPTIDWQFYASNVKNAAAVEQMRCALESFQIPAPLDPQTAQIDAELGETKREIATFVAASAERICDHRSEIDEINARLPFDQMTLEDYIDAFPAHGPDFLNRPTFWPHTKEEQPDAGDELLLSGEAHLLQQICGLRESVAQRIERNRGGQRTVQAGVNDWTWKPV